LGEYDASTLRSISGRGANEKVGIRLTARPGRTESTPVGGSSSMAAM
jgi:hypothetical protein